MKSKKINISSGVLNAIIIGALAGMVIQLIMTIIGTALVVNGVIAMERAGVVANVIRCVAVFIGVCVGGIKAKKMSLTAGIGVLTMLIVLWLMVSVVILDGTVGNILRCMIGPIVACLGGLLLIFTKEKGSKRGYKKKHYR